MSYTLVLEWMPGDLYMSAVTARCTAPTSSYSVVWLPPNKVYQITLYCGSTSLVSFLVGAFRGKAWSYMKRKWCASLVLLMFMMCFLTACESKDVSGTYQCESNSNISMTFQDDSSNVSFSDGTNTAEGGYSVLGDYLVVSFLEEVNWPILGLESPSDAMIFEIENDKTLVTNWELISGDVELMKFTKVTIWDSILSFVKEHWLIILIVLFVLGTLITLYEKITGHDIEDDMDNLEEVIDQKLENIGEKWRNKKDRDEDK